MKRKTVGVISIKDNSLLVVYKRNVWISPGGKPEGDESYIECLLRECSEELPGCVVANLVPFGMWEGIAPHRRDSIECWVFLGDVTGDLKPSREISDARWVPNAELDALPISESLRQIVKTLRFTGRLHY